MTTENTIEEAVALAESASPGILPIIKPEIEALMQYIEANHADEWVRLVSLFGNEREKIAAYIELGQGILKVAQDVAAEAKAIVEPATVTQPNDLHASAISGSINTGFAKVDVTIDPIKQVKDIAHGIESVGKKAIDGIKGIFHK